MKKPRSQIHWIYLLLIFISASILTGYIFEYVFSREMHQLIQLVFLIALFVKWFYVGKLLTNQVSILIKNQNDN